MFSSLIAPVLAQPVRAQTSFDEYWYRYGPYIDKITFTVMKDYTMRLLAFEARELSMIAILPMHLERLRSNRPDAHIFFIVGFSTAGGLHFNVQLWPVKYFELRAALAHLWNRDRIIAESPL
ncbi:MAG: ABC transporter substrate-binding protein, partial [Nitrososphaerota archaeon]